MDDSSPSRSSITRLLAIVAVVIAVALGLNLGRQATGIYRLRREEARLQQLVEQEKAVSATLEARQAYVLTDEYAEEWARTVAKLTQPGEVRVVIVGEDEERATPGVSALQQDIVRARRVLPYWQQWWELFFGPVDTELQDGLD